MRPGGMPAESFAEGRHRWDPEASRAEMPKNGSERWRGASARGAARAVGARRERGVPVGSRACDRRRARDERCFHGRCCAPASLGSGRAPPSLLPSSWDIFLLPAGRVGTFNVELSTKSRRSLVVAPRRRPTCSRQHPSSYRAMPTRPRTTPTAIRSSIPRTTATRRLFYKVSSFLRGERFSPKSCRSSTSSTLSASPCSREAAARASRPLITITRLVGRQVQDYRLPRLC